MNHIATNIRFLEDVKIELTFIDGKIIQFDMSTLFEKYPQFKKLKEDRKLFESGELWPIGEIIYWNEDIDYDSEAVYQDGIQVGFVEPPLNQKIAMIILEGREKDNVTQTELSRLSHINQGDLSRIETGKGNPTLKKIQKILDALGKTMVITLKDKKD